MRSNSVDLNKHFLLASLSTKFALHSKIRTATELKRCSECKFIEQCWVCKRNCCKCDKQTATLRFLQLRLYSMVKISHIYLYDIEATKFSKTITNENEQISPFRVSSYLCKDKSDHESSFAGVVVSPGTITIYCVKLLPCLCEGL